MVNNIDSEPSIWQGISEIGHGALEIGQDFVGLGQDFVKLGRDINFASYEYAISAAKKVNVVAIPVLRSVYNVFV